MEINLLGYTVDEALNEVDKFLDSGMLRGQTTLYICLLYTSPSPRDA